MTVSLTDFERETATNYGAKVHWYAEQHGLHDCRKDKSQDSKQMNIDGSIAEHGFAKLHNVYPNYQLDGPTKVDMRIGGMTVDVKWTKPLGNNLVVGYRITRENAADCFALMRGSTKGDMNYAGYILKDDFFDKADVRDFGNGPCWFLNTSHLNENLIPISNE